MNPKLKLSLIAVLGIALIVLVLTLVQSPGQNVPATDTPTRPSISNGTPTSPSATTPAVVAGTTSQPTPATTATPAPEPTMTREEQEAVEEVKSHNPQSASSPDQCSNILQTQPWCSVISSAKRITRPEWEELLPQAEFFLVEYTRIGKESQSLQHVLVIEQNGLHYRDTDFDRLLNANGISITDANRELIAKAFALMTIPYYLAEEVDFIEWKEGDWRTRHNYDHYLKIWAKLQGLEIWWWFDFENDQLKFVTRSDVKPHVGDYIDVSPATLPYPSSFDYRFEKR